jgi:hypothetical protein
MKTSVSESTNDDISFVDSSDQSNTHYLEGDREDKREGVEGYSEDEIDPNEDGLIDYELYKVDNCGKYKMPVTDRNGKKQIITLYCEKPYCPRCGSKNGLLHNRKFNNIIAKLDNLENEFIRQFVFTLPNDLTSYFKSKRMLKKLIDIVKRVIEKEFGILKREKKTKRGIERKYRLQKKVIASIELSGEKGTFHPHVNILIFEKDINRNKKMVPSEQLLRIKKSYKNAVEKLLSIRIGVIDVHYSYHTNQEKIK